MSDAECTLASIMHVICEVAVHDASRLGSRFAACRSCSALTCWYAWRGSRNCALISALGGHLVAATDPRVPGSTESGALSTRIRGHCWRAIPPPNPSSDVTRATSIALAG
jgi:hypothetical protein